MTIVLLIDLLVLLENQMVLIEARALGEVARGEGGERVLPLSLEGEIERGVLP